MDKIKHPGAIDPVADSEGAIEYLIGLLPPELHDASCWWQFTCSQSLPGCADTLSARLWFWSRDPLDDAALKRWGLAANKAAGVKVVDGSVYGTVQPHYVADPIFDGMCDPLPRRHGVRAGLDKAVSLVIPDPSADDPETYGAGGFIGIGVDGFLANNFAEPSATPEHNALQALFLDEDFCHGLLQVLQWPPIANPKGFAQDSMRSHFRDEIYAIEQSIERLYKIINKEEASVGRDEDPYDTWEYRHYFGFSQSAPRRAERLAKCKAELASKTQEPEQISRQIDATNVSNQLNIRLTTEFEVSGWDVHVRAAASDAGCHGSSTTGVYLEIKPSLGGDYPAVLRQMKTNDGRPGVLVFDQFAAAGATLEQVRKIFAASGFTVLSLSEIEAAIP